MNVTLWMLGFAFLAGAMSFIVEFGLALRAMRRR